MKGHHSHNTFDKQQFEQLFKLHFKYLCNFAMGYVEDRDAAQDICQKVFITLWEKRSEIDPKKSIKSYLFTSVKNRCLNYIRDNKKYRSQILDLDCADFEAAEQQDDFAEADLKNKIQNALASLPEKCRLVFEMSRFQNLKYREIAEELDISQKTVEAHMSKAMKSLREQLKDYLMILMLLAMNFNDYSSCQASSPERDDALTCTASSSSRDDAQIFSETTKGKNKPSCNKNKC